MPETLGDRLEPRRLRPVPERVVRVGAVDDLGQERERRIATEFVLLDQRLKGTFLTVVAELDAGHVERYGARASGDLHHPFRRHEQKLGGRVDELADEPGAGDSILLDALAGDPLHD